MPKSNNHAAMAAAVAVALAVSLGLTMVLGRTLTPAAFGFVALVGGVLAMARDVTELGSGTVAAARIAGAPGSERAILGEMLGLRMALAVLASLGCLALALRPERPDQQAVLVLAAIVVLLLPLGALATVFQARHEPLRPVLIGLAAQLAAAVACVALAVLSQHAAAPVPAEGAVTVGAATVGAGIAALLVLREMATALAVWRAGTRRLGWWPRPRWASRALLRDVGGYGLAALCFGVAVQGSPVLVALAGPSGALEAYAAAFRPIAPLLSLPWIVAAPLAPLLVTLARVDREQADREQGGRAQAALHGAKMLRVGVGIGAAVVVAGHDFAGVALVTLYGERFILAAGDAALALQWLAVALGATIMLAPATAILLARRRIRQIAALGGLCLVTTAAGAVLLLPGFAAVGMAIAVAGATAMVALLAFIAAIRLAGRGGQRMNWRWPAIVLPAAALVLAGRLIPFEGRLALLPGGIAFAVACGAVCWLAGAWRPGRARVPA